MAKPFVVRDPAFDYIEFAPQAAEVVRALLRCPEVQRLRRIKQLGFSYVTYPGAEHTRLQHCVGAAYAAHCLFERFLTIGIQLDDTDRASFIAAALLHDVGHFPFSHATETALDAIRVLKHEANSVAIVTGDTQVNEVLKGFGAETPERVARLISGGNLDAQEEKLCAFLDGNFDVDRLDFIIRDSVHTGVRSGMVDWHRLLGGFVEHDGRPVYGSKNLATIEEFLIARHMMYEKVYFHKTTRGMEVVYKAWLKRIWALHEEGHLPEYVVNSRLGKFMRGEALLQQDLLLFDDADVVQLVKQTWADATDDILTDLARRLLWRDPLKAVSDGDGLPGEPDAHNNVRKLLEAADRDPSYYYHWDGISDLPYKHKVSSEDGSENKPGIEIIVNGAREEISSHSAIARALLAPRTHVRAYVPEELRDKVANILGV